MTIIFIVGLIYLGVIEPILKSKAEFKTRKIIDIFRYIMVYVVMVSCFSERLVLLYVITTVYMISSTAQLYTYTKLKSIQDTENFKMILISCAIELFVAMALTYYTLYMTNPNWFQVNDLLFNSVWKNMFEFIYLTFSILTTYSSGIIVLTGIVPRTFQIIHTVIALTLLAKTLNLVFSKEK